MFKLTTHRQFILILAMIACYAMIFIDESGIAVTLPTLGRSLSLNTNLMHWVINSYLLTLSVLLLLGGKLADLYGARRIFTIGITIFFLASIICASSENAWMIVLGRLTQGIGASLLMPCIMVLIHRSFSSEQFGKAFGLILGFSNFFYAVGPVIGGFFTEFTTWRWFFWINLPIGLICLILTRIAVAKDTPEKQKHFSDIKGLVTFIITLSALIIALMQGADWGWGNAWTITLFVLTALGLATFIYIELNSSDPLLDLRLFQIKQFSTGNIILFCATLCLSAMIFWAMWLEISVGFSPAVVGLALLPTSFAFIFMPSIAGRWRDKSGAKKPLILGATLILFSLIWIALTLHTHSYAWIFVGLVAFGFGIPLTIPVSAMTIMQSVPEPKTGMASGTYTMLRQLALSTGVAVLSALTLNHTHFTQGLTTAMIVLAVFAFLALLKGLSVK